MSEGGGERPRYRHDCKRCRYLGSFRAHDLYFCNTATAHFGIPTVLARYGDEEADYVSGIALCPVDPILVRALVIAEVGEETRWIEGSLGEGRRLESAMLARSITELVDAMLHARGRAIAWKRAAKRIWTRAYPDRLGRHGCAARDVKMRRHGR
jgi:hypothetical protein